MDYSALSRIKLFLLDMEGTFYAGGKLLPGSKRFLEAIGEQGADYLFMTNDSSLNRYEYAAKLGAMGLETPHTKVLTSGYATCAYLKRRQPDAKVYLVGTPALQDEFIRERIDVVNTMPDYIVLGFDTTLTYRKLSSLCQYCLLYTASNARGSPGSPSPGGPCSPRRTGTCRPRARSR